MRRASAIRCCCATRPITTAGSTARRCGSPASPKRAPDPANGSFGRDGGKLTGLMIEAASGIVERAAATVGKNTPEMDRRAATKAVATLNSYGVTAFIDAVAMEPILTALATLDEDGKLSAWAAGAMPAVEPAFDGIPTSGETVQKNDNKRVSMPLIRHEKKESNDVEGLSLGRKLAHAKADVSGCDRFHCLSRCAYRGGSGAW